MKIIRNTLYAALFCVLCFAGCGKNTPVITPTAAPTANAIPTGTQKYDGIPTLSQVAKDSLAQEENYTGEALYGRGIDQMHEFWGEPDGTLFGMWGEIWRLDEDRNIILYFNPEGIVSEFKITERKDAEKGITPAPTAMPKDDPTPVPTNAPGQVEAPFAMVSPVPQSEIVDIVGIMTVDTYPVVDGSTATLPLSEAVFMAATGESAEVAAEQVVHTKTTNSYHRLYDKEVDLLIVYEPAESIVERMKTEPLCIKPIGLDALVFLANTANPLSSLTMEQLVDIYSGKITSWAEVGGLEKELLAFQRPAGSGSQTLMQKLVMGDVAMTDGDNVFRYSTMSDILEGMLSYNNEDNTLGYSVFYYANNMYFEKDLKLMGVDGVIPSTQTIYDGSYKLTNAFYAVIRTDEPADSNARKIFDWLTGEAGQQLVLDLGYVPVQMPAGADISDVKVSQQEKAEIMATKPLEEGQYFVFTNPQNMTSEYYYGDMTVYNHKWEEVANFYNVSLNHQVYGVYTNRYLPVGQIRQNAEGEQKTNFGIFDLELGEYSVVPHHSGMELLDAEQGYFVIPPESFSEEDNSWMNWRIIDGTGAVLIEKVEMSDWLAISKFGNGYLEMAYDYTNWENGMTYRYYDKNLNLKSVYSETGFTLPDTEDMLEGVNYYSLDNCGCLVNADGEPILNWAIFLDKFGDGENMELKTQLYNVRLAEEGAVYPVLYQNKVYVLDCHLNVLGIVEEPDIVADFEFANFYEGFCYYRYSDSMDGRYCYFDGSPVLMTDGVVPDYMETNWGDSGYLKYRVFGDRMYIEEYTADGDLVKFNVEIPETMQYLDVSYSEAGYIMVNMDCGERMQSPYTSQPELVPVYEKTLYYRGGSVATGKGMDYDYINDLDEETALWIVQTGERMNAESESLFEDYEEVICLNDYVILKEGRILYEIDSAYLIGRCNDTLFFLKGNYVYAVSYNGEEYIKALHTFLNND